MLDAKLNQIALKTKNLYVLDLSFSESAVPDFKKNYGPRYIHMPGRQGSACAVAAGLASFGKIILVLGLGREDFDLPDQTLNVKVLVYDSKAVWDYFEEELHDFGPAVLLIPERE